MDTDLDPDESSKNLLLDEAKADVQSQVESLRCAVHGEAPRIESTMET
jgi:hypothetical protein